MTKTALVTGGCRGIGLAVTKRLCADGYAVAAMGTASPERYADVLAEIRAAGGDCIYVRGDVSDASDRERCVRETVERFGRLDVLVNNAGVAPKVRADLLEMTEESFDRVIAINTKGTLFMSQLAAKQMLRQEPCGQKRGTIVNVGSCSAEVSSISRGEYCVSKAGVAMLTQLFADRLAPEGILVHEVRPGVIETDMTEVVHGKYDALIEDGLFPIRRWGRPEDVANAVAALCSEDFLYTTGNYIDVDGGFHIKRL